MLYIFCHTLSLYIALSFLRRRCGVVTCTDTQTSRLLIDLGVRETERGRGVRKERERESQAGQEREGEREGEGERVLAFVTHLCVAIGVTFKHRTLGVCQNWRLGADARPSCQPPSPPAPPRRRRRPSGAAKSSSDTRSETIAAPRVKRKTCQHQITLRQKRIVIKTRKNLFFLFFSFVCFWDCCKTVFETVFTPTPSLLKHDEINVPPFVRFLPLYSFTYVPILTKMQSYVNLFAEVLIPD